MPLSKRCSVGCSSCGGGADDDDVEEAEEADVSEEGVVTTVTGAAEAAELADTDRTGHNDDAVARGGGRNRDCCAGPPEPAFSISAAYSCPMLDSRSCSDWDWDMMCRPTSWEDCCRDRLVGPSAPSPVDSTPPPLCDRPPPCSSNSLRLDDRSPPASKLLLLMVSPPPIEVSLDSPPPSLAVGCSGRLPRLAMLEYSARSSRAISLRRSMS